MNDTLRGQVAEAIVNAIWPEGRPDLADLGEKAADAAIGVVLGVVADEIKALPRSTGNPYLRADDVLAVAERLKA